MNEKPNIILMLIDDLGYGDLSCYNEDSKIHTPNIDALAARGVRLTDCHATSALCTPSRYGLLTGRYNWRSQLKAGVLPGGAPPLIEGGRRTLGTLFQSQGYFTAAVGKWHLGLGWERTRINGEKYGIGQEVKEKLKKPGAAGFLLDGMNIDYTRPLKVSPNDYGFDYFFGTAASLDQPPYVYIENRNVLAVPDRITGVFPLDRAGATQQELWQRGPTAPGYDHEAVIGDMHHKVLQLIQEHTGEPFFIYYPTHAVHGPLLFPEEFRGRSGLNAYADMVLYLDNLVGTMVAKLKEQGILENTMIIFASDNGCSGVADYPFLKGHGHNPSYVFRGKKADIYEGGHRIPAIISWPGHYEDGKCCGEMACLSDLYATFAEFLGVEIPDEAAEDSISLIPALNGKGSVRHSVVHSSGDGSFSLRTRDWKLELCSDSGSGGILGGEEEPSCTPRIPYQLYCLREDIGERKNVAAQYPDRCLTMAEELLQLIKQGRTTEGARQENAGMDSWGQLGRVKAMTEKIKEETLPFIS